MRTKRVFMVMGVLMAVATFSCSSTWRPGGPPSAEKIATMDGEALKDTFWRYTNVPPANVEPAERKAARVAMFDEMVRRGIAPVFTERERELIRAQALDVGMSRRAVVYSWGKPDSAQRETTPAGVDVEHFIYSRGSRNADYVHLENGRVKSWEVRR